MIKYCTALSLCMKEVQYNVKYKYTSIGLKCVGMCGIGLLSYEHIHISTTSGKFHLFSLS